MDFKFHFSEQLKMHPSMQYADAVKLCYQAAFGAEHLLFDIERARIYLNEEFDAVGITDESLFERISDDVCRVNLGAWKREGYAADALFEIFSAPFSKNKNAVDVFWAYLEEARQAMEREVSDFDKGAWLCFLDEYKSAGMPPIHHSAEYRASENPHYRVVSLEYLKTRKENELFV